jgi:3-hydroxyacyl-[acyl-carrier-protein] dehydratase
MRYLLLDRIVELAPPSRARAVKCVSLADDVFVDHFPGYPVMPGALLIEALAQLGGVLLEAAQGAQGRPNLVAVLTMVDRARFRQAVSPGDRIDLSVEGLSSGAEGGQVRGQAHVEGKLAAEAEIGFALHPVTNAALLARRRERLAIWLRGAADDE